MPKKKLNLFLKILITAFLTVVLLTVLGRNHFFLGTVLVIGRWLLLILGVVFIYFTKKRVTPKWLRVSVIVSVLMISIEFGWVKIHEHRLKSTEAEIELSLMTYNLFFKNKSPNSIIARIKDSNPDILVVQELTPKWKIDLDNSIGASYLYKKLIPLHGTHGIGIYSKHPISNHQILNNDNNLPFAQIIELKIGNKDIQLINAHLASPAKAVENPESFFEFYRINYKIIEQQIIVLNKLAIESKDQFDAQVLIGDLNTTPYEPLFREMKNEWTNLNASVGSRFNFNFPNSSRIIPFLTLDYIMLRGNVKCLETKIVEGGSSDHLALTGLVKI